MPHTDKRQLTEEAPPLSSVSLFTTPGVVKETQRAHARYSSGLNLKRGPSFPFSLAPDYGSGSA